VTEPFDLGRIGGEPALDALVDAIRDAGAEARRMFSLGRAHVELKPDRSPVTAADRAVEERLAAFTASRHPGLPFLGEETGLRPGPSELSWLVDPIDGTRAFVRGMPTWSVLVALLERGEPVMAIGYFPAEEDLYVAVRGHGAQRNGERLSVSAVASLADAAVSHGSLVQFAGAEGLGLLGALRDRTHTQRGYADLDGHRNVLLARTDAMIDPAVQPWDAAVPMLLVREAGGAATGLLGGTSLAAVAAEGGVVTSNGAVHRELLSLIASARGGL
jgi:fructose-1,6-bisphosphatase/inositol monophosphatase family enzyme